MKANYNKKFKNGFNRTEQKIIDKEIRKQLPEYMRKCALEFDALILLFLHSHLGFGKKRLKKFYDEFVPKLDSLLKKYELEDGDLQWICTVKLKEMTGIDISEWQNEVLKRRNSD